MRGRDKGSGRSRARADAPSEGSQPGAKADGRDIGWGLTVEDEEEDIFLRRVVFSVLVAVVGCMGAWFLVTTVTGSDGSQRALTVSDENPGAREVFTVKLLEFSPGESKLAPAEQLIEKQSIKSMAGQNELHFRKLPGGRVALCVGSFDSEDSPELQQLLQRCHGYSEDGRRPFARASIIGFSQ